MRGCLSSLLQIATCGLVRLGAQGEPELVAPLLGEASPRKRRGAPAQQGGARQRSSGKEPPPDTTHVLEHGLRDIFADYSVGDVLGQGAFGMVRLAVHKRTGLRYAVKTVRKGQLRRRVDLQDLRREVQILALLSSHPNVAALLQTYEDSEAVHIVLEICEGGELFERIAARGVLTEREAAHFLRMMAEVVRHAHALGIVHRDIKPENFMLSDESEAARIKAVDFGLSQYYRPGRPFHSLVGSAFYVAPEVLRRNYGPPADIWSLGVCLYTLLSGLLPFFGETEREVFDMVLEAELDLETAPWPSISRPAKDLVRRMLNRDPAKRPTAVEVLGHPWLNEEAPDRPLEQVVGRLAALHRRNQVQRAAMVVAAGTLEREDVPGLHALFNHIDVDRNGTITTEELRVALQRQGKSVSVEEVQRMLQAADVDGDGEISLNEFVAASLGRSTAHREDFLRTLFTRLDTSGDALLAVEELTQALIGYGVSADDARAVLAAHDLDSNGSLDFAEFKAFLTANASSIQEAVRRRLPGGSDLDELLDVPDSSSMPPQGSMSATGSDPDLT